MRRTASEVIRELEMRVARLEGRGMGRRAGAGDEVMARELELYIENDSSLYRQTKAIISNQAKHMMKGRWNEAGAIKGFLNVVTSGVSAYRKEFGLGPVDKATKEMVAKALLETYMDQIEEEAGLA